MLDIYAPKNYIKTCTELHKTTQEWKGHVRYGIVLSESWFENRPKQQIECNTILAQC